MSVPEEEMESPETEANPRLIDDQEGKSPRDDVADECWHARNIRDLAEAQRVANRLWEEYGQEEKLYAASTERAEALVSLMSHTALRSHDYGPEGVTAAANCHLLLLSHPHFDQMEANLQALYLGVLMDYYLTLEKEEEAIVMGRRALTIAAASRLARLTPVRWPVFFYLFDKKLTEPALSGWIALVYDLLDVARPQEKSKRSAPQAATYEELTDLIGSSYTAQECEETRSMFARGPCKHPHNTRIADFFQKHKLMASD